MNQLEPVAIVGMSCRFPHAPSLGALWRLLRDGGTGVGPAPRGRFPDLELAGGDAQRSGGFLSNPYGFDPRAFDMTPAEARQTDPQQRLLLELAWEALEDAGESRASIARTNTGVFMGVSWCDHREALARGGDVAGYAAPGALTTFAANRISRFFDLRGPSLALDAACASSLVAFHQAVVALRAGDCAAALVGGAELILETLSTELMSKTGVLSEHGQCRAFGADADGFVRGEGAGVMVLKPLSAVRREDRVHAVYLSSAVRHNGAREWFLRSSQEALSETLSEAWARAAVTNEDIGYVEMHGVATRQGDDAELQALSHALGDRKRAPCRVGSVKSNLGNLGAAGGMAGLIKAVLCLASGKLVPSIHNQAPSAVLQAARNVALQTELAPWGGDSALRTAGVSATSLGGCNVHIVLRQAPEPDFEQPRAAEERTARLVVVSARERELLEAQVEQLVGALGDPDTLGAVSLADVSYSTISGRTHWQHRLAVLAFDKAELVSLLTHWQQTQRDDVLLSNADQSVDASLLQAARAFVQNQPVELSAFASAGRRVSLPPTLWKSQTYRLVAKAAASSSDAPLAPASALHQRLTECTTKAARQWLLQTWILDYATEGFPGESHGAEDGFFDMGMQSAACIDMLAALSRDLELQLSATVVFTLHNPRLLASHIEEAWLGRREALPRAPAAVPPATKVHAGHAAPAVSPGGRQDDELAIVGIGCRFPGAVSSLAAFSALLEQGVDAVGTLGAERWDAERYYSPEKQPGRIYSKAAALLEDIELFDPEFFGISPREAASVDPHQRLLLEVAWEAFEDAGIVPSSLKGSRTGVFIGMMPSDYGRSQTSGNCDHVDGYYATGNDNSFASGRLSYVFGLRGPSLTINTACSSALVALDAAVHQLRAGSCDLALVGAASLLLSPELNVFLCNAGALSPDGRCRTFDESANGFVRGEGAGVVLVKRLSDALLAGDAIHAVIRGTAVNHGGRGAGLTVPNARAQAELVRQALHSSGTLASDISYVEAHGTGTALGDPIELQALGEVFKGSFPKVILGSVKTNIGHLDAAAGMAGLIKVCALLARESIPPPLHQKQLNSRVDWNALALEVPRQAVPWPSRPRVAGVSAFGLGGTNAHAVIAREPRAGWASASQSSGAPVRGAGASA